MLKVKELIELLQKCDPEKLVVFRTMVGDYGFHRGEPFEETGVAGSMENIHEHCVVLCSDEPE